MQDKQVGRQEVAGSATLKERYRLDAEIGQGGNGIVYRAWDLLLERVVAVKVLRGDAYEEEEARLRLLREAHTIARLDHPNIVSVYDAGEVDHQPFFVMQFVQGQTLRQRFAGRAGLTSDIGEMLGVMQQLCKALDYAHEQGVIHRDLKPENVILTAGGVVKLMDFGLARVQASRLTQEGTILGTIFYLAPEQLRGEQIDGRADLYALGVMMYECVTGDVPFAGDSPISVITQHLVAKPAPPSLVRQDLPPGLEAIILKLMDKTPGERYASAGEVLQALVGLENVLRASGAYPQFEIPAPGEAPYKGLQYFDVDDAAWFFGRGAATVRLLERLKEAPFLAIIGASGSGKSSLARAGLLPALHKEGGYAGDAVALPGSREWLYRTLTPTAHPLRQLAECLAGDQESLTAVITLIDDLPHDPRCLELAAERLLKRLGGGRVFLLVDQFEELFTLCRSEEERKAFIDNLLAATGKGASGAIRVVITLRADFYHHCARYENLCLALEKHQAYILSMNQDELRQVIEEPARLGNWGLEAGLADLILQDVGAEPGGLPLLSHALLETWKRRRGRLMTLAGYQEAGGVRGAIAHTADEVYSKLSPEEQAIARGIFLRLTELGEDTQDTRRRAGLDELLGSADERPRAEKVLEALVAARLVTMGQESAEVAHEALIREWPALRGWLEQDREGLWQQRWLSEAARAWERMGRDPGDLYRGARLAQALEWARGQAALLSPLEKDFLEASRQARRRENRARRARWVGIFGVIAVALALVSVAVALAATGRSNRMLYRPLPLAWVEVPAGEFLMGSSDEMLDKAKAFCPDCDSAYEQPQHAVYLDTFQIMAYEVTNEQYAQCVRAGVCAKAGGEQFGDQRFADHPVGNVNWQDAFNFCAWSGGRLPSEAEWEKAGRGGLEGQLYPWGDTIDCSQANYAPEDHPPCVGATTAVGSYPANGYRVFDFAGNLLEWAADWYSESYYASSPYKNPSGPATGQYRVLRGGSWDNEAYGSRVSDRFFGPENSRDQRLGFRCARSP